MKTESEGRLLVETPFSHNSAEPHHDVRAEVWQIAWPSVVTMLLMTTNAILDRAFVGRLGPEALAAVGDGGQLIFLMVSLSFAVTTGTTALVARFTGAREPDDIARAAGQSLALGLMLGAVCTGAAYALLPAYISAMRLSPSAAGECGAFLGTALIGVPAMFVGGTLAAAFRGLGDTRTPLKVMICANIVHVILDFGLIFGSFGLPKLGLRGAGIALLTANIVSMCLTVYLATLSPFRAGLRPSYLLPQINWTARILRIGVPAAVTAILRVTSLMSFTSLLALTQERMKAVAALPIGLVAESIAFMPGFGFSVAASALVGQALGAREPGRAERYGWSATWQAVGIMTFMGVVFFVAAEPFARFFTRDRVVIHLTVQYLRIMALSEPLLGMSMVLTGALQGAGDTLKPALVTLITFWALRLPAAWLLAVRLGYNTLGAWVAMSASTAASGVLTALLFRNGYWKRTRV